MTRKLIPKQEKLTEDSTVKKLTQPEKKFMPPPNQPWSKRLAPTELTIRDRDWQNYYRKQQGEFQKKPAQQPTPQQAHRNSQERYFADSPKPAPQEAMRQEVPRDNNYSALDALPRSQYPFRQGMNVVGDPLYAAPIVVEQERSVTSLTWPAEKPSATTASLSLSLPNTIVPALPVVPPVTLNAEPMARTVTPSSPVGPILLTLPPASLSTQPMAGAATPISPIAPPIPPVPLTVPTVTINAPPIAGRVTPTAPTTPAIVPVLPTMPPITTSALPMAGGLTPTSPIVNPPTLTSTVPLAPVESRTPSVALPPAFSDRVTAPQTGLTKTFGTTDGLSSMPAGSY